MNRTELQQRIQVTRADITTLDVDAIVNAANDLLVPGGGVCGAIHRAAGPQLDAACRELDGCPSGEARITPGFRLPAKHVVHAVGPIYREGVPDLDDVLASAYESSLELAESHQLKSIAFPCISTGIYGFPNAEASRVAFHTAQRWLKAHALPQRVVFCVFEDFDQSLYEALLQDACDAAED